MEYLPEEVRAYAPHPSFFKPEDVISFESLITPDAFTDVDGDPENALPIPSDVFSSKGAIRKIITIPFGTIYEYKHNEKRYRILRNETSVIMIVAMSSDSSHHQIIYGKNKHPNLPFFDPVEREQTTDILSARGPTLWDQLAIYDSHAFQLPLGQEMNVYLKWTDTVDGRQNYLMFCNGTAHIVLGVMTPSELFPVPLETIPTDDSSVIRQLKEFLQTKGLEGKVFVRCETFDQFVKLFSSYGPTCTHEYFNITGTSPFVQTAKLFSRTTVTIGTETGRGRVTTSTYGSASHPTFRLTIDSEGNTVVDVDSPFFNTPEGLLVWKACRDGALVSLRIPPGEKIDTNGDPKHRTSRAEVLDIVQLSTVSLPKCSACSKSGFLEGRTADSTLACFCLDHAPVGSRVGIPVLSYPTKAYSIHDEHFVYQKGETVHIPEFQIEHRGCGVGIHFFFTPEEAIDYMSYLGNRKLGGEDAAPMGLFVHRWADAIPEETVTSGEGVGGPPPSGEVVEEPSIYRGGGAAATAPGEGEQIRDENPLHPLREPLLAREPPPEDTGQKCTAQ